MKIIFTSSILLVFHGFFSAQVGINTDSPKSTLDVMVKRNSSNQIVDSSKPLGIQAPRLTRAELTSSTANYAAAQTGSIIYITNSTGGDNTGQRININANGYYYFDGSVWQKFLINNIYNANGSLTAERTLDYNGKTLMFGNLSTGQQVLFSYYNGISIYKPTSGYRSSIGLMSGGSTLWMFNDENNQSQLMTSGSSTGLAIGSNSSDNPTYVSFSLSNGNRELGQEKMRILSNGNVYIGGSEATEKLQINDGTIRIANMPEMTSPTRTLVADNSGKIGYVASSPSPAVREVSTVNISTGSNKRNPKSFSRTSYTGISIEIPPGSHKIDLNLAMSFSGIETYTTGTNFVRLRLAESTASVSDDTYHPDALSPKLASQGFSLSQTEGVVNGSLSVNNTTNKNKVYYLHINNAVSADKKQNVIIEKDWGESTIVYYPINQK